MLQSTPVKFETIMALRGLASIVIALFHFSGGWPGYLAVEFFLVLCGFVLSHAYLYNPMVVTPTQFISRRIVRLYPMHIVSLFSFTIVFFFTQRTLPGSEDGTLFTLLQQLTLTHNIGLNPHGLAWNKPAWFVSVIFWVNLSFFFFITRNTRSSLILFLALTGLGVIYFNTGHLDVTAGNYYGFVNSGLIRGFSSFLLGIISYRLYLKIRDREWLKKRSTLLELSTVAAIVMIVFWRSGKYSGTDFLAPFLFMFVIPLFTMENGAISKHLRKYKILGEISFSLYLNQTTMLLATAAIMKNFETHRLVNLAVYMILLTIYSFFTHYYLDIRMANVRFGGNNRSKK